MVNQHRSLQTIPSFPNAIEDHENETIMNCPKNFVLIDNLETEGEIDVPIIPSVSGQDNNEKNVNQNIISKNTFNIQRIDENPFNFFRIRVQSNVSENMTTCMALHQIRTQIFNQKKGDFHSCKNCFYNEFDYSTRIPDKNSNEFCSDPLSKLPRPKRM